VLRSTAHRECVLSLTPDLHAGIGSRLRNQQGDHVRAAWQRRQLAVVAHQGMHGDPADTRDRIVHEPQQGRQTTLVCQPIHGVGALEPNPRVRMLGAAEEHVHDEGKITAGNQCLTQGQLDRPPQRPEW